MPSRLHTSTVPTTGPEPWPPGPPYPAGSSSQYSDSTSNLHLRQRLPINTPQMIKECCDKH
jgi:hypothetical protein